MSNQVQSYHSFVENTNRGHGTSMITLTIATNQQAMVNATSLLQREYHTATNIKSRV